MDEPKQLQHTPLRPGDSCSRCGIKFSHSTAYIPCFVEGDNLKTWVARNADALIDAKEHVPSLLIEMTWDT